MSGVPAHAKKRESSAENRATVKDSSNLKGYKAFSFYILESFSEAKDYNS